MHFASQIERLDSECSPCPKLQAGPGRIVLSMIENRRDDLYERTAPWFFMKSRN